MDAMRLVQMANDIGRYFEAEPERNAALDGIAGHLKRFWEPRMRRELLAWVDGHGGAGLLPVVLDAVRERRSLLEPSEAAGGRAAP